MGPFKGISSIAGSDNGPIYEHGQHFLVEILGPFMAIGNILQHQQWAHSRASAAFLVRNTGPIRGHQQHFQQ